MTRGKLIFFERSDTDKFPRLIIIMLQFTSIWLHRTCIYRSPSRAIAKLPAHQGSNLHTDLHFRNAL